MTAYETSATSEQNVLWLEVVLVHHLAIGEHARQPSPGRHVRVIRAVIGGSSRSRHYRLAFVWREV